MDTRNSKTLFQLFPIVGNNKAQSAKVNGMATSKKKLTNIEKIVTDHFENGVSFDSTCDALMPLGVANSDRGPLIEKVGKELGLVLDDKQLATKLAKELKDVEKPSHYFDLIDIVKGLQIPQKGFAELLAATQKQLKTNLTGSRRYVSFHKKEYLNTKGETVGLTNYRKIGKWALENPNFTPSEMAAQDFGINDPLYVDDFLSYQKFFKELEELKEMEG